MLKTYLYLPEITYKEIRALAKTERTSRAKVLRLAIEKGLETLRRYNAGSGEILFKIGQIAQKYQVHGPKDASLKMDEYLWVNRSRKLV